MHPVAGIFPLLEGSEFDSLVDDIRQNGLIEPITLYQGQILDGRNRHAACVKAGRELRYVEYGGDQPVQYVLSKNLHRRHLSTSQGGMASQKALPLLEKEAKGRRLATLKRGTGKRPDRERIPEREKGRAREHAAKTFGTNPRYVSDAKVIQRADPKLADDVLAGKVTIPQAKRQVQREEKRQTLASKAEVAKPKTHNAEIICGDCIEEMDKLEAGSVALIFADPPYNIGVDYGSGKGRDNLPPDDYLAWCSEWMTAANRLLTPTGSFWVMINDEWAAHFALMLDKLGLHRRSWVKWYETFGVNCTAKFNRCSRHIFYCVKDPKRFTFNADAVSRPSDRQTKYNDKRANSGGKLWDDVWQIPRLTGTCSERIPDFPTQVPLAITRAIVGCSSDPGETVLDPFSGSASTGVAAIGLGRKYIGVEQGKRFCELSRLRLRATDASES